MRFMSSVKRETIFYSDRTGTMREKKRKARIWKPELPKLTGSCRLLLYLASAVLAALGIAFPGEALSMWLEQAERHKTE